jgi:hypothetical protein
MQETITVEAVDRASWPPGPWDNEGDREEWRDETTGLVCIAKRNRMGAWCGYVGVPPGHPWHGVPPGHPWHGIDYNDPDIDVHGGLTYANSCSPEIGICHVPRPGEPEDLWWLGFDCAHAWDVVPSLLSTRIRTVVGDLLDFPENRYRDLGYVRSECASLASQVAAADHG